MKKMKKETEKNNVLKFQFLQQALVFNFHFFGKSTVQRRRALKVKKPVTRGHKYEFHHSVDAHDPYGSHHNDNDFT